MILKFWDLDNDIIFDDEHINVIEIADKNYFRSFVEKLNLYCNGANDENEIMLFNDGERIDIKKNSLILFDLFNIELNEKKILTKLYNVIVSDSNKEESLNNDFENLKLEIIQYINKLIIEYPFEYTFKGNVTIEDLLKLINLKFDMDYYNNFDEKLFAFIDIITHFNLCRLLIIPNLKTYLEEEQLIELYKYCKYKKVNLLVLESCATEEVLKYENKLYIDETYDEFIIKSVD